MRTQLVVVVLVALSACVARSDGSTADAAVADSSSQSLPCSGRVVPRCDPDTCDHCFEVIPGYTACAAGKRTSGNVTECATDHNGAPLPDSCCSDADCADGLWCMKGIADAQVNFPANHCAEPDACDSLNECGADQVCVPVFYYNVTTRCAATECITNSDCAAGEICAPTLLDQPSGNHGESFTGVRCIPDPDSCTLP